MRRSGQRIPRTQQPRAIPVDPERDAATIADLAQQRSTPPREARYREAVTALTNVPTASASVKPTTADLVVISRSSLLRRMLKMLAAIRAAAVSRPRCGGARRTQGLGC